MVYKFFDKKSSGGEPNQSQSQLNQSQITNLKMNFIGR